MNKELLKQQWLKEESVANICGWDFSHIQGRYEEENDLPWDYKEIVKHYLKTKHQLLDLDTGGGEFLLSLNHPHKNTTATEAYLPNARLCEETLAPSGIDFRMADASKALPFEDDKFDVIINRHGSFNPSEIYRVLKPNGVFITQQVGAQNDRALVELLLQNTEIPFPEQYLDKVSDRFIRAGFEILQSQEAFCPIKFYDIGALVWFAHIIEWEFPDFTVDRCQSALYRAQEILESNGCVQGEIHRFLLVATKRTR